MERNEHLAHLVMSPLPRIAVTFKMASFELARLIQEETRQMALEVDAKEKQVRMAGSIYVRGKAHIPKRSTDGIAWVTATETATEIETETESMIESVGLLEMVMHRILIRDAMVLDELVVSTALGFEETVPPNRPSRKLERRNPVHYLPGESEIENVIKALEIGNGLAALDSKPRQKKHPSGWQTLPLRKRSPSRNILKRTFNAGWNR
jgi:hypothetical protein